MIELDGNRLTLRDFCKIVYHDEKVALSIKARDKIQRSRKIVDEIIESGERVYGINTGFGILSKVTIPHDKLDRLQVNLIRSHSVGVGEWHSEKESRAILLLRANALAKGFSGVRAELVDFLLNLINHRVHPMIPKKGSVGASGDLTPLAHLASVIIGEGRAYHQGKELSGQKALDMVGLKPMLLAPKEGLSLINGTQQMTAVGTMVLIEGLRLTELADLISAASSEGVLASPTPYAMWIQDTRPYRGQAETAKGLLSYLQESEIRESHRLCDRVQDPYSFRCIPQVHGAIRDTLGHVRDVLSVEFNSATDNPLVNSETGEICSNGNFHGEPVALALDMLAMALSELSSLSERRIAKLIDPNFSELSPFLVKDSGLNSGFMMTHVTAVSLVAENKLLTHPASTDSIPTNNEKEDHVSFGPLAAQKAKTILQNTQIVFAIEALVACQALYLRQPLKPGRGSQFLYDEIREIVPVLEHDRYLAPDIDLVLELIRSGTLFNRLSKLEYYESASSI